MSDLGDSRFTPPYERIRQSQNRVAELGKLTDEDVIAALAGASRAADPLVANVLATEAMNRIARGARVLEHLPDPVLALDRGGRLTYMNAAAERVFGWMREDVAGRDVDEVVELPTAAREQLLGASSERTVVPHLLLSTQEGVAREAEVTATPLLLRGTLTGLLLSFRFRDAPLEPAPILSPSTARRTAQALAAGAALVACVALLGWVVGRPVLSAWHPTMVSMKANTAICVLLLALVAGGLSRSARPWRLPIVGALVAVASIALLTLAQYVWGVDIGIDHLFVDASPGTVAPGRMSVPAGISLLLLSAAGFIHAGGEDRAPRLFQALLGAAITLQLLAVAGYLFQAPELLGASAATTGIAAPTVVAFILLSTSFAFLRRSDGILGHLAQGGTQAAVLLRTLPITVLAPFALAWIAAAAQDRGIVTSHLAGAVVAVAITLLMTGLVLGTARFVRILDAKRDAAVRDLYRQRAMLATAVEARTRDLSETNARLQAALPALARLAAIVEGSRDAVIGRTLDGVITDWNKAAENLLGYTAQEAKGKPYLELLPSEAHADEEARQAAVSQGRPVERFESLLRRKDGERVEVSISLSPIRGHSGAVTGIASIVHDITEQKRAEEQFRALLESAPDAMLLIDAEGRIVLANRQVERLFGHDPAALVGQGVETLMPGRYRDRHRHHRASFAAEPRWRPMGAGLELFGLRRNGEEFPVEISLSPIQTNDGLLTCAAIRDITERKAQQAKVEASLREKETLLKEIHHRVKNNLQVTSSLLQLQSHHAPDAATRDIFLDGVSRVKSMALVHEKLYESGDLSAVDFPGYIRDLTADLARTHDAARRHIDIVTDVSTDGVDLDSALACGLIVNELVSNALKYAFKERASGTITVRICKLPNGDHELSVRDDGVGLPSEVDVARTRTLGLRLVHNLARQLDGTLSVERSAGTRIAIRFPPRTRAKEEVVGVLR